MWRDVRFHFSQIQNLFILPTAERYNLGECENGEFPFFGFFFFFQFLLPLYTYLIFSTLRQHTLLAKAHHSVVGKIVLDHHGGSL
jgi:hypothetical protein